MGEAGVEEGAVAPCEPGDLRGGLGGAGSVAAGELVPGSQTGSGAGRGGGGAGGASVGPAGSA